MDGFHADVGRKGLSTPKTEVDSVLRVILPRTPESAHPFSRVCGANVAVLVDNHPHRGVSLTARPSARATNPEEDAATPARTPSARGCVAG